MATLILTAVGTALGGPIGGAIGALAGQQVDALIFAPKPRQGPRLDDLKVQSSTYGAAIPRLFGTMRVAGTVIWATDLKETRGRQSNGKGRPATETYSYSASFAVALSARAITGVGRIWADGKLLRGAAGDFKTATGFRLYLGGEGQAIDPLIAAHEGIGATPAYRGTAYAVFEDMALASYGNRIPSLSFEVFADADAVSAGDVIAALGPSVVGADRGPVLTGIAVQGDSVRGVLATLAEAMPFSVVGDAVRFAGGSLSAVSAYDRGATRGKAVPRVSVDRAAAAALPDMISIAHLDPSRDHQPGTQRARRDSASRREVRIDVPAAVEAVAARSLAEARLARIWAERTRATVTLPWRGITIAPGDRVSVPGLSGEWRVARVAFEAMIVKLDLVQWANASLPVAAADPGRSLKQVDLPHGATTVAVIDVPQIGDAPLAAPTLAVAANGASAGWRRAALLTSVDGGASYLDGGATALPAVMGTSVTTLAAAGSCDIADRISSVDVALINDALTLSDADDAALAAGANLVLIGDEVLQFGRATPLGTGQWRLSVLWRGRRGTEWAAGAHPSGSSVIMIDPQTLATLPSAATVPAVRVMAIGIGDATGVVATGPVSVGNGAVPLSPVHMRMASGAGGIDIGWVRRSRDGWRWRDGVEVPLAEEREAYRVTKRAGARPELVMEVTQPTWTYAVAERAADAAGGAAIATIEVVQIGAAGVSRPAIITVPTS